jgi:L-lactate dehydrogenase (cytochrome)/(S)-mandelate dehydrogenase
MKLAGAQNVHDLRKLAKRRVPEIMFDYLEGGCDDERGLAYNREALQRYRLVPRYCRDVSQRDLSLELFGKTYAAPFGIAPTGQVGLYATKGELLFAEAAKRAGVPYVMSAVSSTRLEEVVARAPENVWLQLYSMADWSIVEDLARRAKAAGVRTIVLTVDFPTAANREGVRRNGFLGKMPLRIKLEALKHPGWLWEWFTTGGSKLANYVDYVTSDHPMAAFALIAPVSNVTWEHVSRFREMWQGQLVVKGLLHPLDAVEAVKRGADGVYVSNHGGRQLDLAPSPFEMLPLVRKAIGDAPKILVDSGVRRGSDVIVARCLGADLALMGRAPNYGAAAGGLKGVELTLDIVRRETDMIFGQLGCQSLKDLGPQLLFDSARGEFCG